MIPMPVAADSRQLVADTAACQSAASSPGIRVIELHILGIQVQLRSIYTGRLRRWPPSSSYWSPANAAHRRAKRTITLKRDDSFVNSCGQSILIKQSQRRLPLSEVLGCLRRRMHNSSRRGFALAAPLVRRIVDADAERTAIT